MSEPLRIEIPPRGIHATSVRVFVAESGRTLGLDDDAVEDLRLVATEFLANAIEAGSDHLALQITGDADTWTLEARGAGPIADVAVAGLPMSRLEIVRAIATVEARDGVVVASASTTP